MAEESGSSTTNNASKDPGWRYFTLKTTGNRNDLVCKFCGGTYKGGIYRAKQHLVGGHRNAAACPKCPPDVREEIKIYMAKKAMLKTVPTPSGYDYDQDFNGGFQDEDQQEQNPSQMPSSDTCSIKRPKRGPMDSFVQRAAAERPEPRVRQTTVTEAFNKELREKCIMSIANWMYDAAIPFNAVNYPSFQTMCETIGRYGPGFKGPSYHEIRVPCLEKAVSEIEEDHINACRAEWKAYGCTLMVDGWTDRRQRTLINFLVNSPRGSVFIESIDASDVSKTGEAMANFIENVLHKIGPENVLQVVSDNASNMVRAGELLVQRFPHLYWTPCAAHCIDLMLEDIGKLPATKLILKKAMSITAYVYVRPGVVNMLRKFTQKDLCRAGITRFATAYLTLQRMFELKQQLKTMFTSEDWTLSKWFSENDGRRVSNIIMSPRFWNGVTRILKIFSPLVSVLRLVDGEKKPAMGYIYEAMDRAKEAIMKAFDNKEEDYRDVFQIIDDRWDCQLHRPLHAAGFFLNPKFFYKADVGEDVDPEVEKGFYQVVEKYVRCPSEQNVIAQELFLYRRAQESFGLSLAMRQRGEMAPAIWWENFGSSAPHLRKLAIKILSLTCSSSGCERNWSIFENVMTCRQRSDLYINLPALGKLDNMLLEILDGFTNTEFWYVDQGIIAPEDDGSVSFQKAIQRQEEKWWLPVPRVPPGGLPESTRKKLRHKLECANQILKAATSINSLALAEMEVPDSYLETLPKNGRACLGDIIYRYITSENFSSECLLDCLDLSSEHAALEIANRVEAAIYVWRRRQHPKATPHCAATKSSWGIVKDLMNHGDNRELLAERAGSLLLSLKHRFPGLTQTTLDASKIQFNKDIGKSILESYSRVLESLAYNIVARIEDLLYVDDINKQSDKLSSVNFISHKKVPIPYSVPTSGTPYKTAYPTPNFSPCSLVSPSRGDRSPFLNGNSNKAARRGLGVKRVLTNYLVGEAKAKDCDPSVGI